MKWFCINIPGVLEHLHTKTERFISSGLGVMSKKVLGDATLGTSRTRDSTTARLVYLQSVFVIVSVSLSFSIRLCPSLHLLLSLSLSLFFIVYFSLYPIRPRGNEA